MNDKTENITQQEVSENIESQKDSLVKERVNLITSHMYKQCLEHSEALANTNEAFQKMLKEMEKVTENLKESFEARGLDSSGIIYNTDSEKHAGQLGILWQKISFSTRQNSQPQALYRKEAPPLFTGRIIAFNDYVDVHNQKNIQEVLKSEVASMYIPADKTAEAIIKIKHLGDQEFYINQIDAPREFLLRVIEVICGGGVFHEADVFEEE